MIVPTIDQEVIIREALRRVGLLLPNGLQLGAATPLNTPNTLVARDGSGNFAAGTITANLTGTASIAAKVAHALSVGTYLTTTGAFDGSVAVTLGLDGTSAATASKVVVRDVNADFAGRRITQTEAIIGGVGTIGDVGGVGFDFWPQSAISVRFLDHTFGSVNLSITDAGAVAARTSLAAPTVTGTAVVGTATVAAPAVTGSTTITAPVGATIVVGGTGKISDVGGGFFDLWSQASATIRFLNSAFSQVNFSITNVGTATTRASSLAAAGFNMPAGVAPTTPGDGDFWYDGTNLKFQNGATTKTLVWV